MTPVDPRLDALKAAWERYRDRPSSLSKDFDLTEHARISTSLLARMTGCYDLVDAMFAAATPSPTVEGGVGELVKRLRDSMSKHYDPNSANNLFNEAADALTRLHAENDALRERVAKLGAALQAIIDGYINRVRATTYRSDGKPSKSDKCPHDRYMWEDCCACVDDFARAALTGDSNGCDA